jgi:hypothetical protein
MENLPELQTKGIDAFTSFSKAGLSLIPFIGPFLAEIISYIIPNQRMDRVVKYLKLLNNKIDNANNPQIIDELKNNSKAIILFEKSIQYAAGTNSNDKYEYYAEFILHSINDKTTDQIQKERMMETIGELNEIEVLILIYYSLRPTIGMNNKFIEKYQNILFPEEPTLGEPIEKSYDAKFNQQYMDNLEMKNLIIQPIEINRELKTPIIDIFSGQIKKGYPHISIIGELLIKYIGAEKYSK